MNPLARFSAAVALALLLGFPTLAAGIKGETTLARGALRFLVLFGFARVAVHGLAWLVDRYAAPILAAEAEAAAAAAEEERLARAAAAAAALEAAESGATDEALDPIGVDGAAAA